MVVGEGVSISAALKALRETQITALHTVEADAARIQEGAQRRLVGSLVFASDMVGERGVRLKAVRVALRVRSVCASLMVEGDAVISSAVERVLREVPRSVKRTVVGNGACLQAATRARRGTRPSAKGTEVGSAVCSMVARYALRACTGARISAWRTVGGRGARSQGAPRAPVAGRIVA